MSQAQGTGAITENVAGADTGITFTLAAPDTPISTTATADMTDIDPDNFIITAADGTPAGFAGEFEFVWDDTKNNWKLKLGGLSSIDYEGTNLPTDKCSILIST